MRAGPIALIATGVCAALISTTGCASDPHKGYVLGSTFDSGVNSVSVPVFRNASFTPGLEQTLTDAVVKEIMAHTPWRVVNGGRADTELVGAITGSELHTLTNTPGTGLIQEQALTMRIDFTWRDNRDGTVRMERRNFAATTTFIPARGVAGEIGERIEIGEREAIEELARAIVGEMRADF